MAPLIPSHVYTVTYVLQSGNGQWWKYEATMTYLGADKVAFAGQDAGQRTTSWNLRPHFGTQTLRVNQILFVKDLGETQGREDSRHKPKKRLERYYPNADPARDIVREGMKK